MLKQLGFVCVGLLMFKSGLLNLLTSLLYMVHYLTFEAVLNSATGTEVICRIVLLFVKKIMAAISKAIQQFWNFGAYLFPLE